jgi:hypothetical protein
MRKDSSPPAKSLPQALKRESISGDLAAPFGFAQGKLELVPFPSFFERRSFCNL